MGVGSSCQWRESCIRNPEVLWLPFWEVVRDFLHARYQASEILGYFEFESSRYNLGSQRLESLQAVGGELPQPAYY